MHARCSRWLQRPHITCWELAAVRGDVPATSELPAATSGLRAAEDRAGDPCPDCTADRPRPGSPARHCRRDVSARCARAWPARPRTQRAARSLGSGSGCTGPRDSRCHGHFVVRRYCPWQQQLRAVGECDETCIRPGPAHGSCKGQQRHARKQRSSYRIAARKNPRVHRDSSQSRRSWLLRSSRKELTGDCVYAGAYKTT